MDAYSKRIMGYAMNNNMRTNLVIQALRRTSPSGAGFARSVGDRAAPRPEGSQPPVEPDQ